MPDRGSERMSVSRALGLAGSITVLLGSVISIISSSFLNAPHGSYFIENITVFLSGLLTALLVRASLYRWLILAAAINLGAFAHCISSLTGATLRAPPPPPNGHSLGSIVVDRVADGVVLLMQTHLGWPVVLIGSVLLIWSGFRSSGGFLAGALEGGSSTYEEEQFPVIQELGRAPKWPLIYGGFLILCGIFVLFVGSDVSIIRKLVGALITELGFAFFIAFVIGVSIELRAKVEHDKQISKGLLSYIYGVNLDDDMFISTEDYVFSTPVFRRDLTVSYDFVQHRGNKILLKYTLSYLVENVSRNPIDYDVHTFVEQPADLEEDTGDFDNVDIGLQSITIDGAQVRDTDIEKAKIKIADDKDFKQSSYTIKMQPGEKRRIMVVHLIEKCDRDSELWRSLSPCAGLTLIVNWSSQIPMEVRAAPVHPSNHFDSMVRDANSITASLYRPFFPHNGVYFWWSPRRPDDRSSLPPEQVGTAPAPAASGSKPHAKRSKRVQGPSVSI
jgi:hypothetical protein